MKTLTFVLLSFILFSKILSQDWQRTDLPSSNYINNIQCGMNGAIYFLNPNTGWFFNAPGDHYSPADSVQIYKTTNKGVNWFLQSKININVCSNVYDRYSTINGIYFIDENQGWLSFGINATTCGYKSYVYRTGDGGNSWMKIYEQTWGGDNINDVKWGTLTFLDANTGYMWQGTEWGNYRNGLYKTTNGGSIWSSNLISLGDNVQCARVYGNTIYYGGVHTQGTERRPTLFKSTDGGSTFVTIKDGSNQDVTGGIQYFSVVKDNSNNDVLMLLTDKGIAVLNSDNSFTIRNNPVSGSVNSSGLIEFNNLNYGVLYGVFNVSGNYISKFMFTSNSGNSWNDISNYSSGIVENMTHFGDVSYAATKWENNGSNTENRLYTHLLYFGLNTHQDWQSASGHITIDGTMLSTPNNQYLRGGTFSLSEPYPYWPEGGGNDTTARFYYWGGDLNGSTDPYNNSVYIVNSNKQISAEYVSLLKSTDYDKAISYANQTKSLIDKNGVTNIIHETESGGIFFTRTRNNDGHYKAEEFVSEYAGNGYPSWNCINPFISEISPIQTQMTINPENNIIATYECPFGSNTNIYVAERSLFVNKWSWNNSTTCHCFPVNGTTNCFPKIWAAENQSNPNNYYRYVVLTYLQNVSGKNQIMAHCFINNYSSSQDINITPSIDQGSNIAEYEAVCVYSNVTFYNFDIYCLYRVGNNVKFFHELLQCDGSMWSSTNSEYVQCNNTFLDKGDLDITVRNYNGTMQPVIAYKGRWSAIIKIPDPNGGGGSGTGGAIQYPVTYYPVTWEERNSPNNWIASRTMLSTSIQNKCNLDGSSTQNAYLFNYWSGDPSRYGFNVYYVNNAVLSGTGFEQEDRIDGKLVRNTANSGPNGTFKELTINPYTSGVYNIAVEPFVLNNPNSQNPDQVSAAAFVDNIQYMFNLGSIIVNSKQVDFDVSSDTAIDNIPDMNDALSSKPFWLNDGDTLIVGRSAFFLNPNQQGNFNSVIYSTVLVRNATDIPVCTLDVDTLQVKDSADVESLYGYIITGYGSDSFYVQLQVDTLWNIDSSLIGGVSGGFSGITNGGGGDNVHRPLKDLVFFKTPINHSYDAIPTVFNLHQNYPNPFNPATTIKYDIPKATMVTIKVYDILGREVSTLVNEVKQAGYYEAEFNGTNLASGIYFYRINADKYTSVKKMVLVK